MLPEVQIVDFKDLSWALFKNSDIITGAVATTGSFEPDVTQRCQEILTGVSAGTVLDIGSNLGTFVVPMAKSLPAHKFISFEPQPIIYYQLCTNVFLNRLENVRCLNLAVGDTNSTITINVPDYAVDNNYGGWSLDPMVAEHDHRHGGKEESIQLITVDSLNLSDVRLIKIDVEGLELTVLEGAKTTIENNNYPPIVFESWPANSRPWWAERDQLLKNYITNLGYTITAISTDNFVAIKN